MQAPHVTRAFLQCFLGPALRTRCNPRRAALAPKSCAQCCVALLAADKRARPPVLLPPTCCCCRCSLSHIAVATQTRTGPCPTDTTRTADLRAGGHRIHTTRRHIKTHSTPHQVGAAPPNRNLACRWTRAWGPLGGHPVAVCGLNRPLRAHTGASSARKRAMQAARRPHASRRATLRAPASPGSLRPAPGAPCSSPSSARWTTACSA